MREYELDIMVEMLMDTFVFNTWETDFFRMNTMQNLVEFGLIDNLPELARELKHQKAEILVEPLKAVHPEAGKQVELWLQLI
ncbi:hypothetical protein AM500_12860 [Bacillus sp. FJAT-18017]|uniref:hypothetical protein n=1 Tax=Bacillus sp. FJAT-18017 TaxID=1705566 RepID=UPI0006AE5E71|nr:hypothetical protein [Bacillus sp. FJAT-18017]ALC90577.1 hypothetical protein AM500_12860 [Bacillus sp. FJAT-18017]